MSTRLLFIVARFHHLPVAQLDQVEGRLTFLDLRVRDLDARWYVRLARSIVAPSNMVRSNSDWKLGCSYINIDTLSPLRKLARHTSEAAINFLHVQVIEQGLLQWHYELVDADSFEVFRDCCLNWEFCFES